MTMAPLLIALLQAQAVPPPASPAPPARPKPTRAEVAAAVQAEWPRYDLQHAGRLNPLQFSTWVLRANGASVKSADAASGPGASRGVKPVRAMNATARAFATADANHDGGVTPDEMVAFLMR